MVGSQESPAVEVLGLLREEERYAPKELQDVGTMC